MKHLQKILILLCIVLTLAGCTKQLGPYESNVEDVDYHEIVYEGKEYSYNTNLQNILVIGIDDENLEGQADFLGLFIVDRENKTVSLLNLPRETKIEVEL